MALFSRKNEAEKKEESAVVKKVATPSMALPTDRNLASVIVKPHITEKAVGKNEKNVYTFVVRQDANKYDVADAIKALYSVTPVKINIVNKSPRQYKSRSKNRVVTERGMKKAYVYLKSGDSISIA